MAQFDELVEIVARLRGEGGCPWDRAQTESTLRPYLLEEVHETLEALDNRDDAELCKELGDLLFQVVMLSRMAEERGAFTIDTVIDRIQHKMVSRHPHVFDPTYVSTGDEGDVMAWEARKARERPPGVSALDGVPKALPALLRAHRVSEKAARVGFDWPDVAGVRAKLDEEVGELDEAIASGDPAAIDEELGDVLFTLVNLGRHLPSTAEDALRSAAGRFERRFRRLEADLAATGANVYDTDESTLERRWRAVKAE